MPFLNGVAVQELPFFPHGLISQASPGLPREERDEHRRFAEMHAEREGCHIQKNFKSCSGPC